MRPVLALFLVFAALQAQDNRVERWREDLNALAAILKGDKTPYTKDFPPGQKDVGKLYPNLDADIAAIERDIPRLRDGQIHLRIRRLMASAHVGHNSSQSFSPQVLPVTVEWLQDGPMIWAATEEHRGLVGSRVLKVGGLAAEELLAALSPYLSYETEGWQRVLAGGSVRDGTILNELGLVREGKVDLTLDGPRGESTVSAGLVEGDAKFVSLTEVLGLPVWFSRSRPEQEYYWGAFLDDSRTFYIQYTQCADDPKLPFAQFAASMLSQIDEVKPRRVIVDLRWNRGGNSGILGPLTEGLAARRKQIGSPYVLIGPTTFSSGVISAEQLRTKTKAKLVGEATGGLLQGYGEAPSRRLPNSKLSVQWTIKNFGKRREMKPDIAVPTTVAGVLAGRDVVLNAAIGAP